MTASRILLVEDEALSRLATAAILEDEGYEVTEAWDGDQAAKLLDGIASFDALLTDVRIPGSLDDIGVAVYARSRNPAIPVLVVSGYAELKWRLAALDPAAIFISKPYRLDVIAAAMKHLTQRLQSP